MLRITLVVFSLVATSALAERNDFITGYGFTKIMTNCFGDAAYYGHLRKIAHAGKECQQEPISLPEVVKPDAYAYKAGYVKTVVPVVPAAHGLYKREAEAHIPVAYNTPYAYQHTPYVVKEAHHEPLISADDLSGLIEITKAKVSNLTCTLKKLGAVDDYLNLNPQFAINEVAALPHISYTLKHDLIQGIQLCEATVKCAPLEYSSTIVPPPAIKRILGYLQCEKKHRLIACMKEDLKRHIYDIDLSPIKDLFPDETADQIAQRALFVLYGAETNSFDLV